MAKLILLRHGQSAWNKKNIFTGWVDIPLSLEGITEASLAGKQIADTRIDVIYTSELIRSQMTVFLVMAENRLGKVPCRIHSADSSLEKWYLKGSQREDLIPTHIAWQLNERMYGDLQGKNKEEVAAEFGVDQVKLWRRSYRVAPPAGETLEDTAARAIPFFKDVIVSHLEKGENVFVCAHGNSLRAIVMHIEGLSEEAVLQLEIATGALISYEYEQGTFCKI